MSSILIRCDASLSIGSGHVVRCRTLARELKRRGCAVTFLCRRQSGDFISLLMQEFRVLSLPELPLLNCEGLVGRDLYGGWVGCSQVQDAADCLQALSSVGIVNIDWVVVDHYGLDIQWERHLLHGLSSNSKPRLLVIDDLADRAHYSDLLLDQNFFAEATEHRYKRLLPPRCRQLLGPYYSLLGPEYAHLHQSVPKRIELRRVLVFFGGVDRDNLTGRTLSALMDPALSHLEVDVVLGRHSPYQKEVANLVDQRPLTTLHDPLPSLAGLIARADLAIGAGGATTWERACLRLPSLVVAVAANQIPFAEALHNSGFLELLGEAATVSTEQIRFSVLSRIVNLVNQDPGGNLTDGLGTSRVVMSMLGPKPGITLRRADSGDQALLQHWANDLQLLTSSVAEDSINLCENYNSFEIDFADSDSLLLIAESADGCPFGQIGLRRQPPISESESREVMFDFSLDRCARGFGLSSEIVGLGLQVMEQTWGLNRETEVKESEQAGTACFSRAGFVQESILPVSATAPDSESLALTSSRITLLSDRGSWFNHFLPELIEMLWGRGHAVRWIHNPDQLEAGDVCFLLSCGRLLSSEQLDLHSHNLVVHASALPKGQGWSPMSWQILEGSNLIPITLFEAVPALDEGPVYLQRHISLEGHELVDEWRALLAQATQELCLSWLDRYHEVIAMAQPQLGEPTHYGRRRPMHSELDPERPLVDQFNLLRVVDNDRYPAFFHYGKRTFKLHIFAND